MLSAVTQKKEKVFAESVDRNNDYFCPLCGIQMILKKGQIKIAHFAHKTITDCEYEGESQEHYAMKNIVEKQYNNLFPNGFIEKEYLIKINNKKRIIDLVCLDKSNNKIAIEVQHSPISLELFLERTNDLIEFGYNVFWIFDYANLKIKKYTNNINFLKVNNLLRYLYLIDYPILFLNIKNKLLYQIIINNFKWGKGSLGFTKTLAFFEKSTTDFSLLFNSEFYCDYIFSDCLNQLWNDKIKSTKRKTTNWSGNPDNWCDCGQWKNDEYEQCYECYTNRGY